MEIFKCLLTGSCCFTQYCITERTPQPVENRRLQQKSLNVFGLALEDLFQQIVQHKLVGARKGLDETSNVLIPLHGERGQLQAGDPALRTRLQDCKLVW